MITNPIYNELIELGLIKDKNLSVISKKTRDKDIPVYMDTESKIIFLERYETSDEHYEESASGPLDDPYFSLNGFYEDDLRRFEKFKHFFKDKNLLDFGCEWGGFLRLAENSTKKSVGVELNKSCQKYIKKNLKSTLAYSSIKKTNKKFDIITAFHCLEHIPYQQNILEELNMGLKVGGQLIIEVPHAKDFLIQSINLPLFREFTFWSEHLILHTKESLMKLLTLSGFNNISIEPFQRYGYTNHLGWMLDGLPGGHKKYSEFEIEKLEEVYKSSRCESGTSDTLIAYATK